MKTIRFNVNDHVRVRLTDYGKKCLRKNYDDLQSGLGKKLGFPFRLPEEDANGWSKWQAWCLMKELGHHISMGGEVPFETEIEIICK